MSGRRNVRIAELRALLASEDVPPRPWEPYLAGNGWVVLDAENNDILHTRSDDADDLQRLVIQAVNALPHLLDRLAEAESIVSDLASSDPVSDRMCELCQALPGAGEDDVSDDRHSDGCPWLRAKRYVGEGR